MFAPKTSTVRLARRGAVLTCNTGHCARTHYRQFAFRTDSPYAARRQQHFYRSIALVSGLGAAGIAYGWYIGTNFLIKEAHAEAPPNESRDAEPVEVVFEKRRKRSGATKNEARDQISSQHLQVRKSWENPGVFTWGDNSGKVAAPDVQSTLIKNPRWAPFFDGKLLRDLKLTRTFGAAIDEDGNLYQWGSAYNKEEIEPVITLSGKNLISLAISKDRILALSQGGHVYNMSVSQEEQLQGPKPMEGSWMFWSKKSQLSYRPVVIKDLGYTERIKAIASGLEHALLLTSRGRVFSMASGSEEYPTLGQLGVPGLTWWTRPEGDYDMTHEVVGLKGFNIEQIATGDSHSLALDKAGRVFSWGDNHRGQLGTGDISKDTPFLDSPSLLSINKLYAGTDHVPRVTAIAAGGDTSFFTVDATKVANPAALSDSSARQGLGRVTADTWACGHGIWGQLGNGRWTHVQSWPTKIEALSGMFEYDEKKRRAVPIRLREMSVGATHVAAIMDNVTHIDSITDADSENEVNWGADVVFFGNNEFYQLGTGRRNNVTVPTYIQPLNMRAEFVEGKRPKSETHRFHATPRATVRLRDGRWVSFEQRVVCGRGVTAVYSAV